LFFFFFFLFFFTLHILDWHALQPSPMFNPQRPIDHQRVQMRRVSPNFSSFVHVLSCRLAAGCICRCGYLTLSSPVVRCFARCGSTRITFNGPVWALNRFASMRLPSTRSKSNVPPMSRNFSPSSLVLSLLVYRC